MTKMVVSCGDGNRIPGGLPAEWAKALEERSLVTSFSRIT